MQHAQNGLIIHLTNSSKNYTFVKTNVTHKIADRDRNGLIRQK